MLGPGDMLIIGAAALLFFGPDQLPKVAKRAGQAMREVQNTSQAFLREMERAADEPDMHAVTPRSSEPYVPEPYVPRHEGRAGESPAPDNAESGDDAPETGAAEKHAPRTDVAPSPETGRASFEV